MDTIEASREFDLIYNNISSNQAPGLDDYEKSIFLTKAQNQLISSLFTPSHIPMGTSSISISNFSPIITEKNNIEEITEIHDFRPTNNKSKIYTVGEPVYVFLNVSVKINHRTLPATFLNFDELVILFFHFFFLFQVKR